MLAQVAAAAIDYDRFGAQGLRAVRHEPAPGGGARIRRCLDDDHAPRGCGVGEVHGGLGGGGVRAGDHEDRVGAPADGRGGGVRHGGGGREAVDSGQVPARGGLQLDQRVGHLARAVLRKGRLERRGGHGGGGGRRQMADGLEDALRRLRQHAAGVPVLSVRPARFGGEEEVRWWWWWWWCGCGAGAGRGGGARVRVRSQLMSRTQPPRPHLMQRTAGVRSPGVRKPARAGPAPGTASVCPRAALRPDPGCMPPVTPPRAHRLPGSDAQEPV